MTHLLLKEFEDRLQNIFTPNNSAHSICYEAARYSLLSGGKRIRPLLTLVTAKCLGGDLDRAYLPAMAVEMIHTYSLIHDDLPGMDNDDMRRGKPTLHKVYPEGQAILAGDLLLTSAFDLLANGSNYEATEKLQMISILAQRSGGEGMIGGQAIDLLESVASQKDLDQLHSMKTGALIEAAIELGALSANASQEVIKTLRNFGKAIGLAFQIIDDVLDATHPDEKHGKSSDVANGKVTYITLLGIEESKNCAKKILDLALNELDQLNFNFRPLKELANTLVYREI